MKPILSSINKSSASIQAIGNSHIASKKRWIFTIASAFLISILGVAPSVAQENPKEIRIVNSGAGTGGRPLASGTAFTVVHQHKLLEEEFAKDGIAVKWSFFPGAGPATNEAAAAGLVDFALHGDLPLIVGRSTGLKHKIILSLGRFGDTYFVVPSGSNAKTLADLKGKKIGIFKGTNAQLIFNRFVTKHGFTEKDFRTINLNSDGIRQSLTTGDIDGAITTPFSLEARGVVRTLITETRSPEITGVLSLWVSESFETQYPHIVQRVVNRFVDAAHWVSLEENRNSYFELSARSGLNTLSDLQKSEKSYSLGERFSPLIDDYFKASITEAIRLSKEFKLIRRDVSTEGWFEDKYLKQALKEKNLESHWAELDAEGNPKQ